MMRDRKNVTAMEVAQDSDAFFGWPQHAEFENLVDAAEAFLLYRMTNAHWTVAELVEDYTRRLR